MVSEWGSVVRAMHGCIPVNQYNLDLCLDKVSVLIMTTKGGNRHTVFELFS